MVRYKDSEQKKIDEAKCKSYATAKAELSETVGAKRKKVVDLLQELHETGRGVDNLAERFNSAADDAVNVLRDRLERNKVGDYQAKLSLLSECYEVWRSKYSKSPKRKNSSLNLSKMSKVFVKQTDL